MQYLLTNYLEWRLIEISLSHKIIMLRVRSFVSVNAATETEAEIETEAKAKIEAGKEAENETDEKTETDSVHSAN